MCHCNCADNFIMQKKTFSKLSKLPFKSFNSVWPNFGLSCENELQWCVIEKFHCNWVSTLKSTAPKVNEISEVLSRMFVFQLFSHLVLNRPNLSPSSELKYQKSAKQFVTLVKGLGTNCKAAAIGRFISLLHQWKASIFSQTHSTGPQTLLFAKISVPVTWIKENQNQQWISSVWGPFEWVWEKIEASHLVEWRN